MADLGRAALVVSLGLVVYAAVAGAYAAWKGRRRLADSARNALLAAFGSTAVAAAVLWTAQNGYFDDVAVEKVKDCQNKLTEYLTTRKTALMGKVAKEKALNDARELSEGSRHTCGTPFKTSILQLRPMTKPDRKLQSHESPKGYTCNGSAVFCSAKFR